MDKDSKDSKDSDKDNPTDNPKDNPDPNVVALQKKLTDRDKELKEAQAKIEELAKKDANSDEIANLRNTVENLTDQIKTINSEKRKEELQKKFPDILPDLIIGKTDEEVEIIVAKQRKITLENYDKKPSDYGPIFETTEEAQKEIENITKDRNISTDEKMAKVREIKLKMNEI